MWPAGPNGIIREALEDDIVPLETPVTLKNGRVVEELQVRKGDTFYIAGVRRMRFCIFQRVVLILHLIAEPGHVSLGR
jgi:hypothetical protein